MRPFRRTLRRVLHAIDNHGLLGLWRRAVHRAARSDVPARPELAHPFDVSYGVDTGGYVPGEALGDGVQEQRAAELYNTAYYGISPSSLVLAFDHLGATLEDWSRFTFVDLGCGKGRALLVASRHSFGHLLGVELSPELCAIARRNTLAFDAPWQVCRSIEIQQADAASFEFPSTPLVVFLYHPFLAPLLRRVLRNLERSAARSPREIYVLYANLSYPKILARFPFLTRLWDYSLPLSPEDAAADRHGITHERYTLFRHLPGQYKLAEDTI